MSADNGIFILETKDTFKKVGDNHWENTFGEGIVAYRVAYAQGIDELEWYEVNQPYNVGFFLNEVWGDSPVFYDKKEALDYARIMVDDVGYLEYGVCHISRLMYCFPNC